MGTEGRGACAKAGVDGLPNVSPAWVQFAADGQQHVRTVAQGACPAVLVDGKPEAMRVRFSAVPSFSNVSCELPVPSSAKSISIDGRPLPLLGHAPRRSP